MATFTLGLGLQGTHVLITGGAGLIGSTVTRAFLAAGSRVSVLDLDTSSLDVLSATLSHPNLFTHQADISSSSSLTEAFAVATSHHGPVLTCVALASLDLSVLPHVTSIIDMDPAQFERTLRVNVYGTFLTAQAWLRQLSNVPSPRPRNMSLIIVGSESGFFGERGNPDYAASKSAVQGGLLASLKADVPRRVPGARVNAIAPGPVDTSRFRQECRDAPEQLYADAQATTALGKPVDADVVARSIVYLASEMWSANVHGQVLKVDSGKEGKLMWTPEECDSQAW